MEAVSLFFEPALIGFRDLRRSSDKENILFRKSAHGPVQRRPSNIHALS